MNDDFNFMTDPKEEKKIATSGSLKEKKKTATSGSPNVITAKIKAEARKLAESSKGLDIAAFQKKYHIYVMNVDELLEG